MVAEFETRRTADQAVIITTLDNGYTGRRQWTTTPAHLQQKGRRVRVYAQLQPGVRAYFFNLQLKDVTTSSEYAEVN